MEAPVEMRIGGGENNSHSSIVLVIVFAMVDILYIHVYLTFTISNKLVL